MKITKCGSNPSGKGPADWFTGTVRVDPLFEAPEPARVRGASVTFEPGARTAWHTHPLGQTLIVTFGRGRVQRWGGPIEEIFAGDVVWFPPGEKHWHGATPTTAMMPVAIQEALDGTAVEWMEKVSESSMAASRCPAGPAFRGPAGRPRRPSTRSRRHRHMTHHVGMEAAVIVDLARARHGGVRALVGRDEDV